MKSRDELIVFAQESPDLSIPDTADLVPLSERGSDRSYFRIKWENQSAILAHYECSRIENSYFADIAAFLYDHNIPVPKILRHDAPRGLMLLEDLGTTDLWHIRNTPWEQRQILYQKTLAAAHRLHSITESQFPAGRIKLMEPFGPQLYSWERNYFRDNFVTLLCGIKLDRERAQALELELDALAARLASDRQCLVHRDLQSQNVMIRNGQPYLIDFQGMRFGSSFYDLGSLLCDPYVRFTDKERMHLLSFYYGLSNRQTDWNSFTEVFWEASAQRLMQALGAYGFLGIQKGLKSYMTHIPEGLRNLRVAAENARTLPLLHRLCEECSNCIRPDSQ